MGRRQSRGIPGEGRSTYEIQRHKRASRVWGSCIFCIVGGGGQDWWKKKPEELVVKKKGRIRVNGDA